MYHVLVFQYSPFTFFLLYARGRADSLLLLTSCCIKYNNRQHIALFVLFRAKEKRMC